MATNIMDFKKLISFSWDGFKKNIALFLQLGLLYFACLVIVYLEVPFLSMLCSFIGIPYLMMATIKAALFVSKGEAITLAGSLKSDVSFFGKYYLIGILLSVMILIGMLFVVVPGVFVAILFSLTVYIVVDKNTSVMDSFEQSLKISKNNKANIFIALLIVFLINFIGTITMIGTVVSVPLSCVVMAYVYREILNKPQEAAL